MKEPQKVEVWVSIAGYYCNFSEVSFSVEYDITNNKQIGSDPLEYFENLNDEDIEPQYDYAVRSAILIDGEYYVEWN
jgi:hypothetical protein